MSASVTLRFWAKVDKSGECWNWTAYRTARGYGQFGVTKGKIVYAHRLAYELLRGPIPGGLTIDHLCRNTACVNPDHLEPVTLAENVRRAAACVTECPAGHAYDEANTKHYKGSRQCRACDRDRHREAGRIRSGYYLRQSLPKAGDAA